MKRVMALGAGLLLWGVASAAIAEIFKYTDSTGITHYVTTLEAVPEQYRAQVTSPHTLPDISKLDYRVSSPRRDTSPIRGINKKVEILVADWCPHCRNLERYLKDKGIVHTRYNIEKDARGAKMYQELGGGGLPIIKIGNQVIRGFSVEAISSALAR